MTNTTNTAPARANLWIRHRHDGQVSRWYPEHTNYPLAQVQARRQELVESGHPVQDLSIRGTEEGAPQG